jgi:hypothetical protein
MGGDVQHHRRHEAQQRDAADHTACPIARAPRDHAGDRDDHADHRDQRENGGKNAHNPMKAPTALRAPERARAPPSSGLARLPRVVLLS